MRLFIAADLPDDIKCTIHKIQKDLEDMSGYIRFTDIENMHITIKFLSEQPFNYLTGIKTEITKALVNIPRFEINLDRVGVFKNLEYPRVLWLGENSDQFVYISSKIEEKLFVYRKSADRAFCHVTIGRMKYIPKEKAVESMRRVKHIMNDKMLKFSVDMISLYESKLTDKGAVYKKMDSFKLGVSYG